MSRSDMTESLPVGNIEKQLKEQGFYVSTTVGYSMWPMLKNRRDRVVLRALEEGETLKKGDVPLYIRPHDGKHILHRILKVKEDHYIIRGDNTYSLERVPKTWIVGVLHEFYRKGKHVSVSNKKYHLYATAWQWIYPVRFVCHYVKLFFSKVIGRLKRIFKKRPKQ